MKASIWLRTDWQGVAYGLACFLMLEIKHLVSYGLARRLRMDSHAVLMRKTYAFGCVWIGKALRMDWHAV